MRGARMWLERLSTITAHRVTGMAVMASRRTARDSNAPRFQLSPFDSTGIRIAARKRCSSLGLLRKWRDRIAIGASNRDFDAQRAHATAAGESGRPKLSIRERNH